MTTPAKVWDYRDLIKNFVIRDLRSRYKRSFLGWGWSLINPAVTLGIYTLVFGFFLNGTAPVTGNGESTSFALWLFSALVAWNAFSSGINGAMQSFLASGHLLTRTYFPPETPVVAGTLTVAIQTAVESVILVGCMVLLGNLAWTTLFILPIMLLLTLFAFGIGMMVSLMNVRFRDINYLVGIFLQIGFYATPIVYRIDQLPKEVGGVNIALVLKFNPMTHFVLAMRRVTYLLVPPTPTQWIIMVSAAVVSVLVGWTVFGRRAPMYIEEI